MGPATENARPAAGHTLFMAFGRESIWPHVAVLRSSSMHGLQSGVSQCVSKLRTDSFEIASFRAVAHRSFFF